MWIIGKILEGKNSSQRFKHACSTVCETITEEVEGSLFGKRVDLEESERSRKDKSEPKKATSKIIKLQNLKTTTIMSVKYLNSRIFHNNISGSSLAKNRATGTSQ